MRIETESLEEIVKGERRFACLVLGIKHRGKSVAWRVPKTLNPQMVSEVAKNMERMVRALSVAFPELGDAPQVKSEAGEPVSGTTGTIMVNGKPVAVVIPKPGSPPKKSRTSKNGKGIQPITP